MKKVLVTTCVVAMTAFGITNASAQSSQTAGNASTARASAFGIELKSSLLSDDGDDALIDRTGEAESVLPPGGAVEDDILDVGDAGELLLSGTGSVLADTRAEPTIRPILNEENEDTDGGDGEGSGLIGGDLIGGLLDDLGGGDDGGGTLGGVLNSSAGTVRAQQLGGGGDDDDGLLGGLLDDLLGGDSEDDEDSNTDPNIGLPIANAHGYAVVENLGLANDDVDDLGDILLGGNLTDTAVNALIDALLKVEAVQAEAAVLCIGNQPVFDTASRILDLNNENVDLVDELVDTVAEVLGDDILRVNETGTTADGGRFVNALRLVIGEGDLLGDITGGDDGDDNSDDDGDDALIDLTIGHAEVSGTACAPAAPVGTVAPLPPTGDDRILPVTGGGLGALPAVLGLGLAGAAVTAGRLALRSRKDSSL